MKIRIVERNDRNSKSYVVQEYVTNSSEDPFWKDVSIHCTFETADDVLHLIYNKPIPDKVIREYNFR